MLSEFGATSLDMIDISVSTDSVISHEKPQQLQNQHWISLSNTTCLQHRNLWLLPVTHLLMSVNMRPVYDSWETGFRWYVRWPRELNARQIKKTHANRTNHVQIKKTSYWSLLLVTIFAPLETFSCRFWNLQLTCNLCLHVLWLFAAHGSNWYFLGLV